MGKGLVHTLTDAYGGVMYPRGYSYIRYGKCTQSPYKENELWFVTVCRGDSSRKSGPMELRGPDDDHTFLVDKAFAHPTAIDERRRDVEKWRSVAHQVYVGPWCEHFECLWQDVPVYSHTLPSGSIVKYGYCSSQALDHPERELWFVSFRDALFHDTPGTFVVDSLCTDGPFLDRMGTDHWKWMTVCWCRLDEGNEVRWDNLKTGTLEGGYVRSHSQFAFDSPYLPFKVDEIIPRITLFENEVSASRRRYDDQNQGLFNRGKQWRNLPEAQKEELEILWRRRACEKIRRADQQ